MVRADEVAPVVPRAADGEHSGDAAVFHLCGPGFLTPAATPDPGSGLGAQLAQLARAEGFGILGIARPHRVTEAGDSLARWVAEGFYGDMGWMAEHLARRRDPQVLWPQVKSLVMLGLNYGPASDPRAVLARKDKAAISVYARAEDYHDVIKPRLKRIARGLLAAAGEGDVKVFVDTAPLMEKPLAAASGLGWQGKHTNLVSRHFGSWLFLGAIATTLELPESAPEKDHCGSCHACLDACPTAAFPVPYQLDARRCISYLTIEHKGPIPRALRPLMGNRIYGCDDCLAVCPWNKFAQAGREAKLAARPENEAPDLLELVGLDDAAFRARFPKSPVKRIGRVRFVRNVLIALGNSGDGRLAGVIRGRLTDEAPLVRGAAAWALARLLPAEAFKAEAALALAREADGEVRAEWQAGLQDGSAR